MAPKKKLPAYGGDTSSAGSTGGSGTFPQSENALVILENLGISSSDTGLYVTGTGSLTTAGEDLVRYFYMSQPQRLALQQDMANAGYLKQTSVTGELNASGAITALKQLISAAAGMGSTLQGAITQLSAGNLGPLQTEVATEQQQAETEAAKPIVYKPENDTTLAQLLSQDVDQTLGYTPANMDQLINQFISQIHSQDYAQGAAGH
jgi:hypothetical protein